MKTVLLFAAAAVLLLSACGGGTHQTTPSSAAVKEYPLTGEVVSLAPQGQAATIRHDKIEGWMEAMTMEFPVKDKAEFAKLQPGARITATVFVQDADYWLGRIQPAPAPAP